MYVNLVANSKPQTATSRFGIWVCIFYNFFFHSIYLLYIFSNVFCRLARSLYQFYSADFVFAFFLKTYLWVWLYVQSIYTLYSVLCIQNYFFFWHMPTTMILFQKYNTHIDILFYIYLYYCFAYMIIQILVIFFKEAKNL